MNERYKDMVAKINENIFDIKNHRHKIHEEWGSKYIEDPSVPTGIYKRSIIVATNVAEASITIPGLEYVIDNGYAKEASFDEKLNQSKLQVERISEASRIQRKGRVGRKGDGTVYFMYKKGARAKVKPKYKITQQDPSLIFSQLSSSKIFDSNQERQISIIYPRVYDPHENKSFKEWYTHIEKSVEKEKYSFVKIPYGNDSNNKLEECEFYKKGIFHIIKKQFTLNDEPLNQMYFPEPYFSDFKENRHFTYLNTFIDGFSLTELFDVNGQFYLIHPKENKIIRNCFNQIIKRKSNDKKIKMIDINFYKRMLFNLQNKLEIVNFEGKDIQDIEDDNLEFTDITFFGTLLGKKIMELDSKLMIGDTNCITLMNAYGHSNDNKDVLNDTLMILALLRACDYSVKKLASTTLTNKGYMVPQFDKLKEIYYSNKSDIESLYRITQNIKNTFYYLKLFNLDVKGNKTDQFDLYQNQFNDEIKPEFQKHIKGIDNVLDPNKKFSDDWNILKQLQDNGNLGGEAGFQSWLDSSLKVDDDIKNDIKKNLPKIKNFCSINYLNFDTIHNFLLGYFKLKRNINNIDKDQDKKMKVKNVFEWIDDNFKTNFKSKYAGLSHLDKILCSFLAGNSTRVVFKTDIYSDYTIMSTTEKINIEPLNRYSSEYSSFVTNPGPILLYLGISKTDNIQIINNISVNDLIKTNPLYYNPKQFKNIYLNKNTETNLKEIIEMKGIYWDSIVFGIKNNWNLNSITWKGGMEDISNPDYDKVLNKYIDNIVKNIRLYI